MISDHDLEPTALIFAIYDALDIIGMDKDHIILKAKQIILTTMLVNNKRKDCTG